MARDLQGKVAVITGGAEGIGLDIASNFLKNGVNRVILLDIAETLGNEAVETLSKAYGKKVEFVKCDVTKDLDAVSESIFDKYKNVDILVNSAGIIKESDIRQTMAVNATAVIEWSFKFLEHMRIDKGGKGGSIINMSSIYGFRSNDPHSPVYKASKHAVLGFTRTLGYEFRYKKSGVRVVAICPGFTETRFPGKAEVEEDCVGFLEHTRDQPQSVEVVGNAAIEIFKAADSGTAWVIEGGKLYQLTQ